MLRHGVARPLTRRGRHPIEKTARQREVLGAHLRRETRLRLKHWHQTPSGKRSVGPRTDASTVCGRPWPRTNAGPRPGSVRLQSSSASLVTAQRTPTPRRSQHGGAHSHVQPQRLSACARSRGWTASRGRRQVSSKGRGNGPHGTPGSRRTDLEAPTHAAFARHTGAPALRASAAHSAAADPSVNLLSAYFSADPRMRSAHKDLRRFEFPAPSDLEWRWNGTENWRRGLWALGHPRRQVTLHRCAARRGIETNWH